MKYSETKFSDLNPVKHSPGIYQISTNSGMLLKIGISKDIRNRLYQHGISKQSRLKTIDIAFPVEPSNVKSQQSILAKHLFFDRRMAFAYNLDLKTEAGRTEFLADHCVIEFFHTSTREEALELEKKIEKENNHRYIGKVTLKI
jgi:excinuclease UvrABC nuclease subunit